MIVDWAYSILVALIDAVTGLLPDGSPSGSSVITGGEVGDFLVNIGYYVDLMPLLYVFGAIGLFFGAFLSWKLALMLYNLIPILR